MASNIENDQLFRKAIKLLHSSHPNSATELRVMIDEMIKQRFGPEKMLSSMHGKRLLEEEANFPGRAVTPPPQPMQTDVEEVINLTNSPPKTISDSPDTIVDSDDAMSNAGGGSVAAVTSSTSGLSIITTAEDDGNLKEFGDLNCCVCGDMMFTATNRLIECSKCGSLYHQECHKPPISDEEASEDQQHNWQCDNCLSKPSTSKAAAAAAPTAVMMVTEEPMPLVSKGKSSVSSSRSSSSSNSSSPFYKQEAVASTSKPNQKISSSSTTKTKEERSSKSAVVTPSISVITDKNSTHSSSSSSKKPYSSSSKSSSSKSSKHHDSSSGKRKSSK